MKHVTVLKDELVDGLNIQSGDFVIDGTLGGGGHTKEIVEKFGSGVKIIAIDLDSDAIKRTKDILAGLDSDIIYRTANFKDIDSILDGLNIPRVDRILLDLGLSSFQLEESGRGFTFQKDEPLLMNMNKEGDLTAEEIVNNWEEKNLADIIYGLGEERYSRRIARAIVKNRPIKTTFELVEVIKAVVPRKKIHPATKTFQALRIATNSELSNLEKVIERGYKRLVEGGRMGIISFHSLEDRIVKRAFKDLGGKILTKKPMTPSGLEIKNNSRSRSAKLRIIEKI
ncbi:MAG: 16S rRNA (cytosine(1402)-N(4))-methyltransferase RsmH [Patescibacteria group bacterium]|nr:16S rRNA (cytosine(1402)-N(4))-methyltransferase RsmH [Patescibacteria group bacterium]